MFRQYKLKDYDFKLIICVFALSIIGILAVGSAKSELLDRQILGVCVGVVCMFIVSFIDYSFILYFYPYLYVINILLLLSVTFFGRNVGGAQRWVNIFGIQFQPSETAKILLILFFAQFIMKYRDNINTVKFLIICGVLLGIPLLLVYTQPDMSTSIMIMVIFCVMLFIGGLSYKIVVSVLAIVVPSISVFFFLVLQPDQQIIRGYQAKRILAWLQPEKYADTYAYQTINSMTAIGSGQLWGKGLNNNVIASVKNGNFISEPQTDFIFSVAGEELGFMGTATIILLLLFIVIECIFIARKAKDTAGKLICCGFAALVGFQSAINISVNSGLLPNTGLPLPFVSYGLTSLWSLYIGVGLVLNVGLQSRKH